MCEIKRGFRHIKKKINKKLHKTAQSESHTVASPFFLPKPRAAVIYKSFKYLMVLRRVAYVPGCLLLALIKMAEDEQKTLCTGHSHKIPSRSAQRDEDGNKFLLHKKIIIIHGRGRKVCWREWSNEDYEIIDRWHWIHVASTIMIIPFSWCEHRHDSLLEGV